MSIQNFKYGTIKYINNVEVELRFCLIDYELKIIPIDWQRTMDIVLKHKLVNEKFVWMKGELVTHESINVYVYAQQLYYFIMPNPYKYITIYASMYSVSHSEYDISNDFNCIQFEGGILDIVYPVSQIQKINTDDWSVKIKKKMNKKFLIKNDNNVKAIIYNIKPSAKVVIGGMVDFSDIHSSIILELKNILKIENFLDYYTYLSSMLSFLCKQSNIRYKKVHVYNNLGREKGYAEIFVNDNYENYFDEIANCNKVINLNSLDKSVVKLFNIFQEKEKKPNLIFLSDNNKTSNNIYYYSPIAIICSMEKEYKFLNNNKREAKLKKEAKKMKDKLLSIVEMEGCSERVKNKCYSLLKTLEKIEPNSKEKFGKILDVLISDINKNSDNIKKMYYNKFWFELKNRREELLKKYGAFYRIRGSAAHNEIEWREEAGNMYGFIEIIIYYLVLRRVRVKIINIFSIIERLFGPTIEETSIQKGIRNKELELERQTFSV